MSYELRFTTISIISFIEGFTTHIAAKITSHTLRLLLRRQNLILMFLLFNLSQISIIA